MSQIKVLEIRKEFTPGPMMPELAGPSSTGATKRARLNIKLEKTVPTTPVDTLLPLSMRMMRVWQSLDLGKHLTENSQVSKILCPVSYNLLFWVVQGIYH